MTPRRPDAVTAAILAEADAAFAGARVMRLPDREVEDVVQEALLATWRRAQRGDFPTDPDAIRTYLYVVAKHAALERWREIGRVDLPVFLPRSPLTRCHDLRRGAICAPSRARRTCAIVECLAAGSTLHAIADALGIPPGTIATRLRQMRAMRQK